MNSPRTVIALIPAAGESRRMRGAGSKLLLPLGGAAMIQRTTTALLSSRHVTQAIVLAPEAQLAEFQRLFGPKGEEPGRRVHVIPGGGTRQQSVFRGLQCCAKLIDPAKPAYIAVHDGARCLAGTELIDRVIEAAFQYGAVTAAVPLADSLKRVDAEGRVLHSIDRAQVWAVQTPQVFKYELLLAAHEHAAPDATDDASLVEAMHPVYVVEGSSLNFKVTGPQDYEMAKRLIEPQTSITSPS
jgi:2-C-methyl-D-erythritol 4-phosphate cytidylyltransferase